MKAHLLYRSEDFDWQWVLQAAAVRAERRGGRRYQRPEFDTHVGLPWNEKALTLDLGLDALFAAMAREDDCVFEVARKVILAGTRGDLDTIRYRQDILQDCLNNPSVLRELYAIAVEAMEKQTGHFFGILARYPDSVLRDSIELISKLVILLKKLQRIAQSHAHAFSSEGWTRFFTMLKRDLDDEYLAELERHLEQLRFRSGLFLLSAELGSGNKGTHYLLHLAPYRRWSWWARAREWWASLIAPTAPTLSFTLHPRDEAGFKALAELRNRGIGLVAGALGQSADHVRNFFGMLRAELAFYVGCINLHEQLTRKREPVCRPVPVAAEQRHLSFRGLYDLGLTLRVDEPVVGNDADADGKDLLIVTGANSGGKSTFLRSLGVAQLLMQCGMFVPAESFCASLCNGLCTHFKREEDASMESGKLDEELRRMSEIANHLAPHSMILFNESFAATNEREGSEISRQIMSALVERRIRIACVTHLYELAHGFYERNAGNALFLRAPRQAQGARLFKLVEGEPLPTSFGPDLYDSVFSSERPARGSDITGPSAAAATATSRTFSR
jgi:MutS domain V